MIRRAVILVLMGFAGVAAAQDYPLWERLLSHCSQKADEATVPSMTMGALTCRCR